MMKTASYMKWVWIPCLLVMLVIVGYYAYETPNPEELLPIWLPWTAIMLVTTTIGYMIFAYSMKTGYWWIQVGLLLVLLGAAVFGIKTGYQDGDHLSGYPICAQGVLALIYMMISTWKLITGILPEQNPEPAN